MIRIASLQKTYKASGPNYVALDHIDLVLPNTGFVALYGENGCGKTTLLNILSTIDTDYDGEISYHEIPYRANENYLRRSVLSYVFQEDYFVDYLNIRDNLMLFCEDENMETVQSQLSSRKISEKIKEMPSSLSGGQKQRVSFIRGVTKSCRVLLVDEPTSSLNEEMEQIIFEEMRRLSKDKLVVLVSHNLSLIRNYCDFILHMDKAKITGTEELAGGDNILYYDDHIAISSVESLPMIDKQKAKTIFDAQNGLRIEKAAQERKKSALTYDAEPLPEALPEKKLSRRFFWSLAASFLHKDKSFFLFMGIIISLIGVLFSFILSMYHFDTAKFTYQSLNRKGEYVYFNLSDSNRGAPLNAEEYQFLRDSLDADVVVTNDHLMTALDFAPNGIYNNLIYKTAYCQKDDIVLSCGSFPAGNTSIMITDYIANGFMLSNKNLKSYSDILENGIDSSTMHFQVSGIIDTDFEKYLPLYDDMDFKQSRLHLDYDYDMQNKYGVIYYSYHAVNEASFLSGLPLNYGDYYADILSIEKYNEENSTDYQLANPQDCYINPALKEMMKIIDEEGYIKLKDSALSIKGVVDDGSTVPKIYTQSGEIQQIKYSLIHNITSLNIRLTSESMVGFLLDKGFTHYTSASGYITDTVNIVTLLQNFFIWLLAVLALLIFGMVAFDLNKSLQKQQTTLAFMKITGYGRQNILLWTFVLCAFRCLFTILLSCLLFIVSAVILNAALSGIFNATVALANISAFTILTATITLIAAYVLIWLAAITIKLRKDIIQLLKN